MTAEVSGGPRGVPAAWRSLAPGRSPATAPPQGNPRFPHCDAVRGLAILAVIVVHAGATIYLHGDSVFKRLVYDLFLAVEIFFVLSGFLLYRPFVAARLDGRATPSVRSFARRRILRIVPAYWVALAVLAAWPGLTGVYGPHWWAFFGFAYTYLPSTYTQGLPVAWSLSVEVGFYALLPLFVILVGRLTRGRPIRGALHIEVASLATLALLSVAVRTLWVLGVLPLRVAVYSVAGFLDFFALGMFLAVVSAASERGLGFTRLSRVVARAPWLCWAGALAAYGLLAAVFYVPAAAAAATHDWFHIASSALPHALAMSTGRYLAIAIVAVLVVTPAAVGVNGGGLPRRILSWRPLAFLGVISYGVYLWHQPLLGWLAGEFGRNGGPWLLGNISLTLTLVTFAVSTIIAVASYYIVELPFLRRKEGRWRPRRPPVPGVMEVGAAEES